MVSIKVRFKMAWRVFFLKSFNLQVGPTVIKEFNLNRRCDWPGCTNRSQYHLSRTIAVFRVEQKYHQFLCAPDAVKVVNDTLDRTEKL